MVGESNRPQARAFLQGLSTSELEYIAEFLGSCAIEGEASCQWSRTQLSEAIERFDVSRRRRSQDRAHRMVLLFEYLCRTVPARNALAAGAGQSS
jgi:hypothetical protein